MSSDPWSKFAPPAPKATAKRLLNVPCLRGGSSMMVSEDLSGFESLYLEQYFLKKRFHLFIFRERERKGERDGEKHPCVVASCAPPTGDLACNPGICPDWESNQ